MNNNMNNTNAPASARRNRHDDAVRIAALLATLRQTEKVASHYETYKSNFENCKNTLTAILTTALTKEQDAHVTLNGCHYQLNERGIESMLNQLDRTQKKYQESEIASSTLPMAIASYISFVNIVINGDEAVVAPTPASNTVTLGCERNTSHLVQCNPNECGKVEYHMVNYEGLFQQVQALSDRLYEFESRAGNLAMSAAKDAMTPDVNALQKRLSILEGRVEELEEIGERVPDFEKELGDIYKRIITLEEKAKPPIRIPAESCDKSKLMKLFGITPVKDNKGNVNCSDNGTDGCDIPEMESVDIPEILDADVQTGDIMALDTNDITAVRTGDIKVGRIGHNINIKVGGNLIINGDEDNK